METLSSPTSGVRVRNVEYGAILVITVATFMGFYCPQPLLPTLAAENGVSEASAGLLITATILPFAVAPLLYTRLLRSFSLARVLEGTVLGCAFCLALCAFFADSFPVLLCARTAQGLLLPGILLCLTSRTAALYSGRELQNRLALYAAMTMVGAYGGRLVAGAMCTWYGASWALCVFAAAQFAVLIPCRFVAHGEGDGNGSHGRDEGSVSLADFALLLRDRNMRAALLVGPVCIFAYSAILNFLPFHIRSVSPGASELVIGLVYVCGLVNAVTSTLNGPVLRLFGEEWRLMKAACLLFLASLPFFWLDSLAAVFVPMLGASTAFAVIYANAPGIVNRLSPCGAVATNTLYLAVYYCVSAAGSFFPILVYADAGLTPFLILLLAAMVLDLWLVVRARRNCVLS